MRRSLVAAAELERALGELMSLLDAGGADPRALERAASACETGFHALRAGYEADQQSTPESLAGTLRTNAIALDLVTRRLEGVRRRLGQVRAARRALTRDGDAPTTGDSCDVAG